MHVSGYSWIELEPIGHMLLVVFLSATQNPPLTSKGFPAHGTRIVAGLVQSTTSSSTHDHPTTRKQLTAYLHTTDTPIYMKICSMGADAQQRLRQEKQEELRFRLPPISVSRSPPRQLQAENQSNARLSTPVPAETQQVEGEYDRYFLPLLFVLVEHAFDELRVSDDDRAALVDVLGGDVQHPADGAVEHARGGHPSGLLDDERHREPLVKHAQLACRRETGKGGRDGGRGQGAELGSRSSGGKRGQGRDARSAPSQASSQKVIRTLAGASANAYHEYTFCSPCPFPFPFLPWYDTFTPSHDRATETS